MKVLLLTRYGANGASSRIRHFAYVPTLAKRGVTVTAHSIIDDADLESYYDGRSRSWSRIGQSYIGRLALVGKAREFDLIWIEKEALPYLPAWVERCAFGRARVPVVIDFDDLWFRRHSRDRESFVEAFEVRKFRRILQWATAVTAANGKLADALFDLSGRRATVLENCIDVAPYKCAAERRDARPLAHKLKVGWIGTPQTANLYLPAVAGILNALAREGLSETLLIGAGEAVECLSARRVAWNVSSEADAVADVDIGIQPLVGTDFDACKSGWKVFQYMAAGKPVVASRVGFIAGLIEDGVNGFLVDDAQSFDERLRRLLSDPELRKRMGRNAQAMICERFAFERGVEDRLQLFAGLVAAAQRPRRSMAVSHSVC